VQRGGGDVPGCRARTGRGKKLLEAAKHWALSASQPGRNHKDDDAERERHGIDKQAWDAASEWADESTATSSLGAGTFAVWPCNWPTLQLFLACQTTWEYAPIYVVGPRVCGGGIMRMNYDAVMHVLNARCQARKRRREFVRIQAMEFAAVEAANE
jgi:hypothetical protein